MGLIYFFIALGVMATALLIFSRTEMGKKILE